MVLLRRPQLYLMSGNLFITRSLQKAEGVSDAGDLAHVEALNEQQQEALRRSQNIADQYSDVASDYDATRTRLRDTAGLKDAAAAEAKEALATNQSQAALGGASGSARQQAREDAQANNLARSFADLDYQAEKGLLRYRRWCSRSSSTRCYTVRRCR